MIEKIEWERLNIDIKNWFISFRGNACNGTNERTVETMIKTSSKIVLTMIEIIPRNCDDLYRDQLQRLIIIDQTGDQFAKTINY